MPIDLSESKTRSINLTSAAGTPADADSTPTYSVTLPDGTAGISPAVQHGVLGEYYVVYPTTTPGLHQELWIAVVGGTTVVIRRNFTVEQPGALFIDTEEAIAHMRAAGIIVNAADLEQLRWLCAVACDAVERDLNRVLARRTFVETRNEHGSLAPHRGPVVSITSVVVDGVTADPATYRLNSLGILETQYGRWTTSTIWGTGNVVVTYVAGDLVPAVLARQVAMRGVARMWQSSQQMPHPAMDDIGADSFAPIGVLTPLEIAPYTAMRRLALA